MDELGLLTFNVSDNVQVKQDLQLLVRDVHSMIQQWRARCTLQTNAPNMRRMQDSIDWSLKLVEREEERSLSQAHREQVRQARTLHLDMVGSMSDVAVPLAAFQEQVDIDGPAPLGSLSGPGTFSTEG